jgi:Oxidoreductase family, NAD-binding Rossmann fold
MVSSACDLDAERLKAFAATFAPLRTFTSFDEMLTDRDVDAIVICLPNSLHYPCSLKALEAGKYVLCEKPPTMNAAQMRTLHDKAQKRGLLYYFGRQMRFSPAMQTAKRIVAERRVGEIYFAETMWVNDIDHRSRSFGSVFDAYGRVVNSNANSRQSCTLGGHYRPAPIPYFMEFSRAAGMPAGYLPGHRASHGCVPMPRDLAACFSSEFKLERQSRSSAARRTWLASEGTFRFCSQVHR